MDTGLIKKLLAAMGALGIALLAWDFYSSTQEITSPLERSEKNRDELFTIETSYSKEDITVTIDKLALTEEEINEMFQQAVNEIETGIFSKGDSADFVSHSLNLKDSYVDGRVEALWQSSNYHALRTDGTLNYEEIEVTGSPVTLSVILSCQDSQMLHSFTVNLYPLATNTYEGFMYKLNKVLKEANEDSKAENICLPNAVDEVEISWKRKMDFRGLELLVLTLVAAVALKLGDREDRKRQQKERESRMLRDYPVIVNNLAILMGAGISFKGALERISKRYSASEDFAPQEHPGIQEMIITCREMAEGTGERAALENLAKRTKVRQYRKLSMMLTQNLQKGSAELIDMLEKEDMNAFEMRKQMALKAGEEASTKLLLPMGGMLMIVIVILIVPAFMTLNL